MQATNFIGYAQITYRGDREEQAFGIIEAPKDLREAAAGIFAEKEDAIVVKFFDKVLNLTHIYQWQTFPRIIK